MRPPPRDASTAACAAAAGEADATSDSPKKHREYHEDHRGDTAAAAEGGGDGEAGEQRLQDEVYLYSLEKGFLMLRPDLRRKHGIVTANVTVSAHDPCLGGTVVQVTHRLLCSIGFWRRPFVVGNDGLCTAVFGGGCLSCRQFVGTRANSFVQGTQSSVPLFNDRVVSTSLDSSPRAAFMALRSRRGGIERRGPSLF